MLLGLQALLLPFFFFFFFCFFLPHVMYLIRYTEYFLVFSYARSLPQAQG
ncbi:uncharacterized protein An14g01920 [Aspergillus niger]|uniref:Contig An14c0090, genomic contig n=2 Tax=Aspergillus niger TaxID=5061 RepID=A2R2T8_ASPNC|nr:uncharacterized protein An14g01920 [Aspergillus niger]CAK41929.1 unnamed protein product [Aspergillus niger]